MSNPWSIDIPLLDIWGLARRRIIIVAAIYTIAIQVELTGVEIWTQLWLEADVNLDLLALCPIIPNVAIRTGVGLAIRITCVDVGVKGLLKVCLQLPWSQMVERSIFAIWHASNYNDAYNSSKASSRPSVIIYILHYKQQFLWKAFLSGHNLGRSAWLAGICFKSVNPFCQVSKGRP